MAEGLPSLELRCLGPPSARVGGREPPPELLWRKHLALLTYLALSPDRARTRGHLMGLLWGESPDDKARRSLNEAIRVLRAALGSERLLTHGDTLQLNPQALEVDVLKFDAQCAAGQLGALDLVRGDFLEGFHVEDATAFDAWLEGERSRIRDTATRLLIARGEGQLGVNRFIEARALARRALVLSPYSEPAVLLAMSSAALEGDAAGALALYHGFAEQLKRDLGEPPSPALSALAGRIRAGKWRRPRGRLPDLEPPLIGRRDQHAKLFATLERPDGPVCAVIAGDIGTGRSRLIDVCAERLALAGATVAVARILESDWDAPWSTLRALVRGGLLEAPGIAATDTVGLRVLAGIVPELASRVPPLEPRDATQVSDGLASLLRAATDEQAVAILIDDAQWADGPSLAALRALWARVGDAPLAVVASVQAGVDHSTQLRTLISSVGREVPGVAIRLDPFTVEEIATLTETMAPWCKGNPERERLARRVMHESAGNPFLAATLLRDLAASAAHREDLEWPHPGSTYDTTLPITIPGVVRSAIVARVARLDPDATAVLRAASIPGEVIDPQLVAEVAGLPLVRVEAALDRLERERFIVFEDQRYAFNGRLLPAVIEGECILPGGRQRLREQYIAALATREAIDSQLLRARLLLVANRPNEAFDAAMRVAGLALEAGANRAASTAIRTAEQAAGADPERLRSVAPLRERVAAQ